MLDVLKIALSTISFSIEIGDCLNSGRFFEVVL